MVPLIVGARIVGTLACWSCTIEAFTEDDVRILELMASQVASAIVSADAHETSQLDAHTDSLTSLPNRRQLSEDAAGRFESLVAEGRLTVAMADIDHFKRFNDEFGHQTGDITLQKIAEVLRLCMREGDAFYRYGGEEFAIVVQDMSDEACTVILERLRVAVARTPLTGTELQPVGPVTLSIGFASGEAASFDALLGMADTALYESKSRGRNRLTNWSDIRDATMDGEAA